MSKSCYVFHDDAIIRVTGQFISNAGTVRYDLQLDVEHHLLEPMCLKIQEQGRANGEGIYCILNKKLVHLFEKIQSLAAVKCLFHSLSEVVITYSCKHVTTGTCSFGIPSCTMRVKLNETNEDNLDAEFYDLLWKINYVEVQFLNVVVNLIITAYIFQDEKWKLKFGVTNAQKNFYVESLKLVNARYKVYSNYIFQDNDVLKERNISRLYEGDIVGPDIMMGQL